jgi:NAD(P)-dependent dehydrogenase (short-subunit alcohol dehydrogenase family)
VLINNAGIAVVAPLDQFSLDDFDRMVAVNIRAVFVAAQEAARQSPTSRAGWPATSAHAGSPSTPCSLAPRTPT